MSSNRELERLLSKLSEVSYRSSISRISKSSKYTAESIYNLEKILRQVGKFEIEGDLQSSSLPPSTNLTYFASFLVPATKLDDALASLEDIFPRILERCGGNEIKAAKIYKWNIVLIVVGYHKNRFLKLGGLCMAYLGFGKLWQVIKGFIF